MNILIVSPPFPPFSGVGALRMKSLAVYLRDHVNNVFVIRNEPSIWGNDNRSEVPKGLSIIDVWVKSDESFEKSAQLYETAIGELLSKNTIDFIIYSVGPYFTLKSAIKIKERFNVKYTLDFRDLWIYEKKGGISLIVKLKRFIKLLPLRKIEKRAVKDASLITVVDPGDHAIMKRKYNLPEDKIYVIYNGHEVENTLYEKTKVKNAFINVNDVFTIINLGKFGYYSFKIAEMLLTAINELVDQGVPARILHVGKKEEEIEEIIEHNNIKKDIYKCTGYLSYDEGIALAKDASAALIIYKHTFGFGTKVFDYIACNKPIILMCNGNEKLAEFVRKFKNGYVCTNKSQLVAAVNHIYKNRIDHLDKDEKLKGFSRNEQNEAYYNQIIIKNGESRTR